VKDAQASQRANLGREGREPVLAGVELFKLSESRNQRRHSAQPIGVYSKDAEVRQVEDAWWQRRESVFRNIQVLQSREVGDAVRQGRQSVTAQA
jgi:hypothetical protein